MKKLVKIFQLKEPVSIVDQYVFQIMLGLSICFFFMALFWPNDTIIDLPTYPDAKECIIYIPPNAQMINTAVKTRWKSDGVILQCIKEKDRFSIIGKEHWVMHVLPADEDMLKKLQIKTDLSQPSAAPLEGE